MLNQCLKEFHLLKNSDQANISQSFFKTGPGEYGEGDLFLGIKMPLIRAHAKKYINLKTKDLNFLIKSQWHEERMLGLLITMLQYEKACKQDSNESEKIYNYYIKNKKYINNWDLVDVTAPRIVGHYLFSHSREILFEWAKSRDLWTRRISVVATLFLIKKGEFKEILKLSQYLLDDTEDLMHKAVGWMLREVGKKDKKTLDKFLIIYQSKMPRTMLRYAIEKHSEKQRHLILKGTFKG